MKILLVSNMYAYAGNWDKLDALSEYVELAVVTPSSWRTTELHPVHHAPSQSEGASWKYYPLDTNFQFQGNPFRYFYKSQQLVSVIEEYRPDLVHVEQEPESLSLLQLSLLKSRFQYRLIFIAWENIHPLRLGYLFRKINFRFADAGIVGNQAALERCRRLGFRKRLDLIPQYSFEITCEERLEVGQHSPFVIGYAGRLVTEKGILTLVDAVRQLSDVEVRIAGDGPLADQLRDEPQFRMLGTLPRSELGQFWRSIDVLVVPSLTTPRWAEQFGRVIAEAMAAGVPVIGSSSGAIPEVIGDAGIVFSEGDAVGLAEAIESLRVDPARRARLIEQGLDRIRRHYGNEVIMQQTVQFYKNVVGE